MTSPWLTVPEAADYLRMTAKYCTQTVMAWARRGKLKGKKVGKRWLFSQEQLDAFDSRGGRK